MPFSISLLASLATRAMDVFLVSLIFTALT
jgi:hypothetical protein